MPVALANGVNRCLPSPNRFSTIVSPAFAHGATLGADRGWHVDVDLMVLLDYIQTRPEVQ